ncbi:hypothetical protein RHGRI_004517 [Rhododendron griersonianum]|uniref:BED-type domain-containing protein n=1 Tax=Rhododendron griersonianum TaxID=479676 RepID=A0AAV6L9X8_9ERIC|nr:hypothetical protein RHGRI_004517 [Rhododendron griersonianum]
MTSSSAGCLSSSVNDEERPAIREAIWLAVSHSVQCIHSGHSHSHTQMDDSGVTGIGNNVDNEPITVDEQSPKRSPKCSPKRRANQSEVRDHFEKLEKVPRQKQKAVYNHCGQIYTCDSNTNGTSSMKTHMKLLCRQYEFSQFNLKKNPGKRQKNPSV